jgi:hypothetical protein
LEDVVELSIEEFGIELGDPRDAQPRRGEAGDDVGQVDQAGDEVSAESYAQTKGTYRGIAARWASS